jgi:hypothetical protein
MFKHVLLICALILGLVVPAMAGGHHGDRSHHGGGRHYGGYRSHTYYYSVPAYPMYPQAYYSPRYVPPVYSGPPVIHHQGVLDYLIVKPWEFLFGYDEVVPSPPDRDEEENRGSNSGRTPESGW